MGPRRHVGAIVIATVALCACVAPTRQVIRASALPAPVAMHTILEPAVADPAPALDEAMCRERATERLRRRVEREPVHATYVLAPSLTHLDISAAQGTVACSIEIRVTPTTASGAERWEGGKTAIAVGRAQVTSAASPHEVELSIDACVDSAAEQVLAGRVLPFLERSVAVRSARARW